jgi:hypothetical protein
VPSSFHAHREARAAGRIVVADINDLDLPALCTADGEGGVQDDPAAYHKGFKEGRGMIPRPPSIALHRASHPEKGIP